MLIVYDNQIVVSRYEHLHGRLLCYIWLRPHQTANEYTNKEDNDRNSSLRHAGNEDLRGEVQRELRPKGRRSMRTAEDLRKGKSKKWKNS